MLAQQKQQEKEKQKTEAQAAEAEAQAAEAEATAEAGAHAEVHEKSDTQIMYFSQFVMIVGVQRPPGGSFEKKPQKDHKR